MLLVKSGYVIDPRSGTESKLDILADGGKIVRMEAGIEEMSLEGAEKENLQVVDAEGKIVAPGLVDVHVHFRDPGFTYKEDIFSGAEAAAKGGFTTVVLMANTKPAVDCAEILSYVLDKGAGTGLRVRSCATITVGMQGRELTDMEGLKDAGAVGFTDDGMPLLEAETVRRAMEEAARLGVPLSFHEENPAFIENNGVNRGRASAYFGIWQEN